jgi:uncharacterized heparinase superfamily protein
MWKKDIILPFLEEKAILMLGWLESFTFANGDIPMTNDSTFQIAPSTSQLVSYAKKLELKWTKLPLTDSGYRKLNTNTFELLFDVGQIAPSYQPGHSHADNLQFILHASNRPIIVDTGISTYEKNERRQLERSTCSHNTISIDNENSSQVWSGFRVGKRAKTTILKDSPNSVKAIHDGFKSKKILCEREIRKEKNNIIVIDNIVGRTSKVKIEGHLHFHPDVEIELDNNKIILNKNLLLEFSNETCLTLSDYEYCQGFNHLIPAKKIIYTFQGENQIYITKV